MTDIILLSIKKEELIEIIKQAVKQATEKDLLNFKEAKEMLGVSSSTLNRWKAEDKIPYHRFEGRIYFYRNEIMRAVIK